MKSALDKNLKDVISSNEENFTKLLSKIQNLDLIIEKIPRPMDNVYFNFKASKNTALSRNKFKTSIDNTHQILKEILEFIKEIKSKTGIDAKSLKELEEFCKFHKTANKLKDFPDFFVSDDFKQYAKVIYGRHL